MARGDARIVNRRPTGTPYRRRTGTPSRYWHDDDEGPFALVAVQGGRSPPGGATSAKRPNSTARVSAAVLEAPAVVAGLDDVAVVGDPHRVGNLSPCGPKGAQTNHEQRYHDENAEKISRRQRQEAKNVRFPPLVGSK